MMNKKKWGDWMRLIDADALREEWLENGENEYVYDTNAFLESIDEQPTIEAVPVVHGEWIFKYDGPYGRQRAYCSACGKRSGIGGIESNQKKPFCPNCGADMRKKV